MDSRFEKNLTSYETNLMQLDPENLNVDPIQVSEAVSAFAGENMPLVGALGGALLVLAYSSTYRQRRRKERRLTGRADALEDLENMKLPRKARAHEENPALPAVRVRKERKPYKTISSIRKLWWVAGGDYDEPQMVAIGMTGAGKNQTLLDPTVWNVLHYREESAVVMDVKGELIDKFAQRTRGRQFAYSFMEEHDLSSAINLIQTPKMAATTAAALYPVKGTKVPAFNMGARDLFEALAEALGHSESNIVELFGYLKDPEAMNELAGTNERLARALAGENRKFISDVISSARLPLSALNRPEVARVFAPEADTPQPHFSAKETVWICIPQDSEDVALLAGAIIHNLYNRATKSRRGTYFLVDEAGSTITIENLDHYLQVGRGLGAYFFLILQDISQLQDKIGAAKTRSVLGSAGVQFWGKTQDTETADYVSSHSGTVRVSWAVYEDEGSERAWKQLFHATGAPYGMQDRDREGILPAHVHGLPKGWWYAYTGNPNDIKLVIPAPMHEWEEKVLPAPEPCEILGIPPKRAPQPPPPAAIATAADEPLEDPGENEAPGEAPKGNEGPTESEAPTGSEASGGNEGPSEDEGPPEGRACPGCERPVSAAALFCEGCGGRL